MRNIYLLLIAFVLFSSCEKEFKSVFDNTPAEREVAEAKKWKEALISSEYGWMVHYYPNPQEMGGYTFIMKFNDKNEVTMNWGFRDEQATSLYSVKIMENPLLSFDTYNVISKMVDPQNGQVGVGFGGENEFAFVSLSKGGDTLYMCEREKKDPFILVKATAQEWENIKRYPAQDKILEMKSDYVRPFYYNLHVDGWDRGVSMLYFSDAQLAQLVYKTDRGHDTLHVMGVNMTHEGFEFRVPLVLNGVGVRSFKYIPEEKRHIVVNSAAKGGFQFENTCMAHAPGMCQKFVAYGNFGTFFTYYSPKALEVFDILEGNQFTDFSFSAYKPNLFTYVKIGFADYTSIAMDVTEFTKLSENEFKIIFKGYDSYDYTPEQIEAIMATPKGKAFLDLVFSPKGWTIYPRNIKEYGAKAYWVSNEDPTIYFTTEEEGD